MDLYERFGVHYDDSEHDINLTSEDRIKLQKALLLKLQSSSKSDKASHEGVKELSDMISDEIEHQYIRKEHMENRAGFLMALWGIVTGFVISNVELSKLFCDSVNRFYRIASIVMIASGIVSLGFLCYSLWSISIQHYGLEKRITNTACAAESLEMFRVRTLEILSNVWEYNEKVINRKGNTVNLTIVFIVFYIIAGVIIIGIG